MGDDPPLVLCVEDDPDAQQMLKVVLEEGGYRFAGVNTCADALRLIREGDVAVLLLDNWLPDCTGIDLCRQVRQFNKQLPIIFFSGAAYNYDRDAALEAGANDFLTKPCSLEELFSTLIKYAPSPKCKHDNPAQKVGG
jgi:DNA-binding response OmpR family regulator